MKTNRKSAEFQPNRVLSYFKAEWRALLIVTVSGLIYNIGLLSGPWFEGTMTGYLVEILNGTGQFFRQADARHQLCGRHGGRADLTLREALLRTPLCKPM